VRTYHVYILASESRELYVGITNDLAKRVAQHRSAIDPQSYTTKHRIGRLVYCESTQDVLAAIKREKQIKSWTRRRRLDLIEQNEPKLGGPGSRRLASELRPLTQFTLSGVEGLGVTA
jgi:putative endonuclease